MEGSDLSSYPHLTTAELLQHLARVSNLLIASHGELSIVLIEEHKSKLAGYFTSEATSISGREWDAKKLSQESTIARFEMEAQIAELTEEKYLILRILDEKNHGA